MAETQSRWIRTDASSDLLNSLEHCLLTFTLARSDERNWKWTVAAAHSAAQIAMVMTLMNAQQDEHLRPRSQKPVRAYCDGRKTDPTAQWPDTKLASFMDLYCTCVKYLPPEVATLEQEKNIRRLNALRNSWTHFGQEDLLVTPWHARIAVQAGIKLVTVFSPTGAAGLYRNHTDQARHETAISTLLRLLEAAERDDQAGAETAEDDDARYAALEAQLAAYGDDEEAA